MSEPVLTFTAAELAEHNDQVRADAVAAERCAAGAWISSPERATLLARVGADVLAEVER